MRYSPDKVQVTDLPDAVKCKKRKGKKPSANVQSENPSAHAKCNSPQSCKKCRIMRRLSKFYLPLHSFNFFFVFKNLNYISFVWMFLFIIKYNFCVSFKDRSESKPRIQNKKPSKSISIEQMTEKITIEKSKPKYSDISDSESASSTHENNDNSIKSTVCVSQTKNETKSITHFPHSDHQYSRISFYGSGSNDSENLSKHEPSKAIAKEQITVPNKTQNPYAAPNRSVCIGSGMLQTKQIQVVRPKPVIYRFRPNTDVRQPTPAYFMPHFISNSSTTFTQTSQVVRSIHKPNSSTQTIMPTQFRSPTTILHRPEIHHPIYYVSFCEPQMLQRYSNHN